MRGCREGLCVKMPGLLRGIWNCVQSILKVRLTSYDNTTGLPCVLGLLQRCWLFPSQRQMTDWVVSCLGYWYMQKYMRTLKMWGQRIPSGFRWSRVSLFPTNVHLFLGLGHDICPGGDWISSRIVTPFYHSLIISAFICFPGSESLQRHWDNVLL